MFDDFDLLMDHDKQLVFEIYLCLRDIDNLLYEHTGKKINTIPNSILEYLEIQE